MTELRGSRYDPLGEFLKNQRAASVTLTFTEVEELVGALPPSARRHGAWWSNNPAMHPQAEAWLDAGWRVQHKDIGSETVAFVRLP